MINSSEFGKRLTTIMGYYQLSASAFADKIQVQRSSISHLLSGRNRPSLDFVMKVVKEFKEVELYWLLNGKGSFPNAVSPTSPIDDLMVSSSDFNDYTKKIKSSQKTKPNTVNILERIIFFYSDGSFKEYLS